MIINYNKKNELKVLKKIFTEWYLVRVYFPKMIK